METTISTYYDLTQEVTQQLEEAIGGGQSTAQATTRAQRVALGLRLGLLSRVLAIGALADTPPTQAAMYDCLRAMCEAAAHLSWLVDDATAVERRSGCIELGQAKADVENRTKLVAVQGAPWIAELQGQQIKSLSRAKTMLIAAEAAHPMPCVDCKGRGRREGHVQPWLKLRALRAGADTADINLYALWVACSADAHQLVPQRHEQPDGHHLELPPEEVGRVVVWSIDVVLQAAPMIAAVVNPTALADIEEVRIWWDHHVKAPV